MMQRPGRDRDRERAWRGADHDHADYWTRREHERYEDRVSASLDRLQSEVHKITARLTWLLGGIAVLVAIVSFVARYLIPPAGSP